MVNVVGIFYGWFYFILFIIVYLLGCKVGWLLICLFIIVLVGMFLFLFFVVEYFVYKDVNCCIDDVKNYWVYYGVLIE